MVDKGFIFAIDDTDPKPYIVLRRYKGAITYVFRYKHFYAAVARAEKDACHLKDLATAVSV